MNTPTYDLLRHSAVRPSQEHNRLMAILTAGNSGTVAEKKGERHLKASVLTRKQGKQSLKEQHIAKPRDQDQPGMALH